MPYINEKSRNAIDPLLGQLLIVVKNKGDYNYVITRLMHQFILRYSARFNHSEKCGLCYDSCNDAMGILACAQAELYRTIIGKYEDKKRLANGSVSVLDSKELSDVR